MRTLLQTTNLRRTRALVVGGCSVLVLALAACGGSASGSASLSAGGDTSGGPSGGGKQVKLPGGQSVSAKAHGQWTEALKLFKQYEKSGWNDGHCDEVAGKFAGAAASQKKFAEALYMTGLSNDRCGRKDKAQDFYRQSVSANSKFCKGRVAIAVAQLEAGQASVAEREFAQSVVDDPQCTEGYVNLAIMQRKRGLEGNKEALANLRRALAIDAQYLPAFNEMALLYVQQAKDNVKMLDLAEVVCSQAQKIDTNFPAIYNTWGLIDLRRKEIIGAAAKFQKAFQLDPKMFEAYMNFAQITIGFRGYEDARSAFTKALELQPKSFDALIGLGVAYRGLEQKDKAEEYYNKAKDLNPNRPESYYNLGLLYQDFKDGTTDQMKKARAFYEQFLQRAGSDDRYKGKVDDVKRRCAVVKGKRRPTDKCIAGRFQNIEDYLQALKDMEEMEKLQKESERQQAELEAQQKKEEAQMKKQAAAAPPPADAPKADDKKKPADKADGASAPAEGGAAPADKGKGKGKGKK